MKIMTNYEMLIEMLLASLERYEQLTGTIAYYLVVSPTFKDILDATMHSLWICDLGEGVQTILGKRVIVREQVADWTWA